MNSKTDFVTATVDLTDRCNDSCKFCFNKNFLNSGDELTLEEIQKKLWMADQKFPIRQIILSGGEPTVHPNFFEIYKFFAEQTKFFVSLNTNSVVFRDKKFCEEVLQILQSAKNKRQKFSLSLSNVDHWPAKTVREKNKIGGIKNALAVAKKAKIKIVVVVTITKQNFKILPELAKFISSEAKQDITFSLRGLYLDKAMTAEQKAAVVPPDFSEIRPLVEEAISVVLKNPKLKLRLFGLPLCYFRDFKKFDEIIARAEPWWHEVRIKIRKNSPISARHFYGDIWDLPECSECVLAPVCNKIQTEFLKKYNYPSLRPF